MNQERSLEIEFLRSELVGPARPLNSLHKGTLVEIDNHNRFRIPENAKGSVFWKPNESAQCQEVIFYRGELPTQRYGIGILHPKNELFTAIYDSPNRQQTENFNPEEDAPEEISQTVVNNQDDNSFSQNGNEQNLSQPDLDDDFEIISEDKYKPSVMGLSFCLEDDSSGELIIALPSEKKFFWQLPDSEPFLVNGAYARVFKLVKPEGKNEVAYDAWKRIPATDENTNIVVKVSDLKSDKISYHPVNLKCGIALEIQLYPRKMFGKWIVTCVLRNQSDSTTQDRQEQKIGKTLFQSYFEIKVAGGAKFARYPEGSRSFEKLDKDEQTLAILYRDSATWAIGHGTAAAWDIREGQVPELIYADCMPAVELPSMTPDIEASDGSSISLSMRELGELKQSDISSPGWRSLERLITEYSSWISDRSDEIGFIEPKFREIAHSHIDDCMSCLSRIKRGLELLKTNLDVLEAFKLANKSMLLQQIATKQLKLRPLVSYGNFVGPQEIADGISRTPWEIWVNNKEGEKIGSWRAFQAAFILLSLPGLVDEKSDDRDIVDLIWFPTGGGKTEAYLGVASFYIFYQRIIAKEQDIFRRDGTNVFMRYTLRMLTTQQFQRAASLICAMEFIRSQEYSENQRLGKRKISLGLWIGGEGSPNNIKDAKSKIENFRKYGRGGNPLVLTECPWCRSAIGRIDNRNSKGKGKQSGASIAGIVVDREDVFLKCSDVKCFYGQEYSRLPIAVIDDAIYREPPSLVIGTVDKFAMMAWQPKAGALFGFEHDNHGPIKRRCEPPGLIIQDEFHLISGPIGTVYGLYEGIIEELCANETTGIPPKIIASTATIRGAEEQVRSVYGKNLVQLFPSPGLKMSDSFFGRSARIGDSLCEGRLYLGIYATGYKSFLTTQVRAFSAALFRSQLFDDEKKDAWWTLLTFYNSIRELGGAQTLFSSDISARLKDYSLRYGLDKDKQRYLNTVEELTSRRTQAELVNIMDRLSQPWNAKGSIDVCLASNIIEVGVDIERLAIMAVVGQPKSTAQYIQVTGRVGRKWWERPGLILSMYNPAKSRDLSHFEQFHSYHRRLYERVEPTSATPFSIEALKKALWGALILWARQHHSADSPGAAFGNYKSHLKKALELLVARCEKIVSGTEETDRVVSTMHSLLMELEKKWSTNPQMWWEYPQKENAEYLMLWTGEYATPEQNRRGTRILSSMRNVDSNVRATISSNYFDEEGISDV